MSEFSERLNQLIKETGMTQKEFAARAKITESAVCYYIKGLRTPSGDVLARIAEALNISTDYLLGARPELTYLQRNLSKLDSKQLEKATKLLKDSFEDIFDDNEDEE